MRISTIEELARTTGDLEEQVPRLKGAFPDFMGLYRTIASRRRRTSVYVLGTIKAGKSTLVNALIGRDLMPRGSGVKTFTMTRVENSAGVGGAQCAELLFKSPEQLSTMFAFDFRVLGHSLPRVTNPYEPDQLAELQRFHRDMEAAARREGRLRLMENDDQGTGLLSLALARVRNTLAGLDELQRRLGTEADDGILTRGRLFFEGDHFNDFLHWMDSPELAALMVEVRLQIPSVQLPPLVDVIDCQGSDSLNPMDFAAVQSVLHKTDKILYVVHSRLGLRQADRQLLSYLKAAGVAERIEVVVNVEAFEPLSSQELGRLVDRIAGELRVLSGTDLTLYSICSLFELSRRWDEQEDDAELIRRLWSRKGLESELNSLGESYGRLLAQISHGQSGGRDEEGRGTDGDVHHGQILPSLINQARVTAQALLGRDERLLGVRSAEAPQQDVEEAVARILEGEKKSLRETMTRLMYDVFDAGDGVQRQVKDWLDLGAKTFVGEHPAPGSLRDCDMHGPILEVAVERFNDEWLSLDDRIKLEHLAPVLDSARHAMMESIKRVMRLLPKVVPADIYSGTSFALLDPEDTAHELRRELGRLFFTTSSPKILTPVVLSPTARHRMTAEFYSQRLFSALKERLSKSAGAASGQQRKASRLWSRAIHGAFRQARIDTEFSVSSARENFKFQYLYKIADGLLHKLESLIVNEIDRYFSEVGKLEKADSLLLSAEDRRYVEKFLSSVAKS